MTENGDGEQSRLKMARIPAHKSDSGKQMLLGHKWKHLVIRNSIKMLTINLFFPRVRVVTQEVFFSYINKISAEP